ncbi:MAG: flagellar biosynthesis protein [Lachnospiraceae bacterium]|nr:flagellar biosynthesis protein [Lachnospiraceae bacterium]
MPERIQNTINRIVEWWKKFTSRQKAIMISMAVVVVVAIAILGYVFTRPSWVVLKVASDAKEAQNIQNLLTENKITFEQSKDGMTFSIHEEDTAQAQILLGTNDISSEGYSIDDVVNGSFSTTEADKEKKYRVFLENKFAKQIEKMDGVSEVDININVPHDDGTIIASNEESSAAVKIKFVEGSKNHEKIAKSVASFMAANLRNTSTKKITVIDNNGNTLYNGTDDDSSMVQATTQQEVKDNAEKLTAKKVKEVLAHDNGMNSAIYDNVDVSAELKMSFTKEKSVDYKYYVDTENGKKEGYLDSRTETNTSTQGGSGGTPGTDTNDDDTTYVTDDNGTSKSESSSVTEDYLPSELITTKDGEVGKIDYDESSITIVATNYITYDEDEMKKNGELKKQTFAEFRAKNNEKKQIDVDDNMITAVSNATGLSTNKITILAYEVPLFHESTGGRTITDYLQIIIALLVFALLGFVVFRSLKKEQEEEVEEEVSVDDLLAEQNEQQEENLEDIGFNEKSEARVLIEKFVDENPEAVANLLRNWLNEDWG